MIRNRVLRRSVVRAKFNVTGRSFRHLRVGLSSNYGLWDVPKEDGTFSSNRNDKLLVRRDGNSRDTSRVTNSFIVADTLVIVPKLNSLVFTSRHEVFSLVSDSKSVDLSRVRSIEHSDGLSIEAIPVGNLSV